MILQCPSCQTRFLVNSSLIPAEGRDVKCAKCAHQWFVEGEPPAADYAPIPRATDPVIQDEPAHFMQARLGDDHPEAFNDDDDHHAFEEDEPRHAEVKDTQESVSFSEQDFSFGTSGVPAISQPEKKSLAPLAIAASLLLLTATISGLLAFRHALQPTLGGVYALLGMPSTQGLALADVEVRERPSRSRVRYVVEGAIMNESKQVREVPVLRVGLADKNGEWVTMREYQDEAMIKAGESYPFKVGNLETAMMDRVDHVVIEIGNDTQLMLRD